jgi:hypothetical protein
MKIKGLKVKLKYGCFFVSLHANHSTNNRNIKEKMKRISMMAVALESTTENTEITEESSRGMIKIRGQFKRFVLFLLWQALRDYVFK